MMRILVCVYDVSVLQAETEAAMSALREEAVGLREALDAQRTQLERHYAGLHSKMRKEYEQVRPLCGSNSSWSLAEAPVTSRDCLHARSSAAA
jgi:hypothetical protein